MIKIVRMIAANHEQSVRYPGMPVKHGGTYKMREKGDSRNRGIMIEKKWRKYDMKDYLQEFWEEESGIGVVEIILILVILIMLVVIFRTQITAIVTKAFEEINSGASTVNSKISIGKDK